MRNLIFILSIPVFAPLALLAQETFEQKETRIAVEERYQEYESQVMVGSSNQLEFFLNLFRNSSNPDQSSTFMQLAETALKLSQRNADEEVIEVLSRMIKMEPDIGELYSIRGEFLLALGDISAAEKDFRKALMFTPGDPSSFVGLGKCLEVKGVPDSVVYYYSQAVQARPEVADYNYYYGRALVWVYDFEKGIKYLNKAISIQPKGFEYYEWRVIAFYEIENYQGVVNDVALMEKLSSDKVEGHLYYRQGMAFQRLEKTPESVYAFERALQLLPEREDTDTRLQLGFSLLKLSADPQHSAFKDQYASQAYDHGLNIMKKEPTFSAAYSLLVGSLTQQGKYNEAIEYATQGIALSPDYANLYIRRGYAFLKMKNYKRAFEDYNMGMKQGGSGFVPSIDYKQELDQASSSTNR